MQAQEEEPLSESELQSNGIEQIAFSKTMGIITSSSAIISLISSSIFIWILNRSNARFSSTYHRVLLGMSVGDILFSLSFANFNYPAPSDDDYYVWNARGNQATCSAQGFAFSLGSLSSIYYTCSLILYSLAVVKFNKTDSYIRTKIEPFLHGVPIGWGLIYATIMLIGKNFNSGGGVCTNPVYDPPHCIGYDDGEVREGFNIPCGRGRDGAVLFLSLNGFITFFAAPIVIGTSLWMIYRAVKQQERAIARYGAGSFAPNTNTSEASSGTSGRLRSTIRSGVSFLQGRRRSSRQSSPTSNSRVVQRRAFAFTASLFLTWSFNFIIGLFIATNKDAPLAIHYLSSIFNPLQGFFNLCIFLQPTVFKYKSRGDDDTTWCQAVMEAIWYSGRGDRSPGRGEGRSGGHGNRSPQPQPIEGGRGNGQPKTSQTQRMSLEAQEEVQQAPGVDGMHDSHVPSDVDLAQSDTVGA